MLNKKYQVKKEVGKKEKKKKEVEKVTEYVPHGFLILWGFFFHI